MNKLFILVLSLFVFSVLTLDFHLSIRNLWLQNSGLRIPTFTWNLLPINLLIDSLLAPIVQGTYLHIDMRKFESSQKDESRTQSVDSSKACRKPRDFNWTCFTGRF